MRIKELQIRGLLATIVGKLRKNDRQYTHMKRIVSPEWIQLWFIISDGGFDQDLWSRLSEKDRDFMGYAVHSCQVKSPEFQKALARSYATVHQRLMLIEGSIAAGNLNRALVDEYKQIVDRLAASYQIGRAQATNLMNRIERTFATTKSTE